MIITIDGPAGSGKSTVARELAAKLGIAYLDTGSMYRAVALAALTRGVSLTDEDALIGVVARCKIEVDCDPIHPGVALDGRDVSEAIRSMAVHEATSDVARIPKVRARLVELQRAIGQAQGSLVSEGRDQGTVVFPDADIKFFLDADIEKRAQRRYQEVEAGGEQTSYDSILRNLKYRDDTDQRQWAPLLEPETSIHVNTTDITIQEAVDRLLDEVRRRIPSA